MSNLKADAAGILLLSDQELQSLREEMRASGAWMLAECRRRTNGLPSANEGQNLPSSASTTQSVNGTPDAHP